MADTFRSLRHRNYRLYFVGQLISLTGSWMQTTALMWVAFDRTHESFGPALVSVAQIIPTFLLGVWGGALADRLPKRSLLLVTQTILLGLALMLAGLVWRGPGSFWPLVAITAAAGIVQAIDFPARLAFVIDMVGRDDVMNAVALNSSLFNVARATGPALAGWLIAGVGPEICFLFNGLSYIAVIGALWKMDAIGQPRKGAGSHNSALDGIRYLGHRPALSLMIALAGIGALCGWPFLSLLPALAELQLGAHVQGYSWLLTGTGLGALTASLVVARFGSVERRRPFIGSGIGLVSVALIGLSVAPTLTLAIAWCAMVGFGLILLLATAQTVVQLSAGEHNRGRVMGIWAMVLGGTVPVGNLIAGGAAYLWDEPRVLRAQGFLAALGAGIIFLLWLRQAKSPRNEATLP